MKTNNLSADIHRLLDIVVEEVSLVDRAANKQRFLIVKRSDEMNETTEQTSDATTAKDTGVGNTDATTGSSDSDATKDTKQNQADQAEASKEDGSSLQQIAVSALTSLTEAVELLGTAGDDSTRSRVVELAGELRAVADQLAGASDAAESPDTTGEAKPKPGNEDIESLIESVKAALQRVSAILSGDSDDDQADSNTQKDNLATLINEMRALTSTVKEQQQRLTKLEKRFGMPSSVPAGEGQSRNETEEVGWPLDLNRSCDRESVDKAVSFHDV